MLNVYCSQFSLSVIVLGGDHMLWCGDRWPSLYLLVIIKERKMFRPHAIRAYSRCEPPHPRFTPFRTAFLVRSARLLLLIRHSSKVFDWRAQIARLVRSKTRLADEKRFLFCAHDTFPRTELGAVVLRKPHGQVKVPFPFPPCSVTISDFSWCCSLSQRAGLRTTRSL